MFEDFGDIPKPDGSIQAARKKGSTVVPKRDNGRPARMRNPACDDLSRSNINEDNFTRLDGTDTLLA
ncbi:MAG TPA: hypothetical protein VGX78_01035, partial [Pirellulales bacterium]|nr:hypothetical protein [Pirellulales bacterium]